MHQPLSSFSFTGTQSFTSKGKTSTFITLTTVLKHRLCLLVCLLTFAASTFSQPEALLPADSGAAAAVMQDTVPNTVVPAQVKDSTLQLFLDKQTQRKRTWIVAGSHVALYGGSLLLLNQAWYADYPRSSFHTFNDWDEWLQVDKVGHAWSAYQLSRASAATWRWAGMPYKKQVWLGGMSGFAFQTVIEILDGFSAEWGWSWGDFGANLFGSGLFIAQELGWREQRINFKFSFHTMSYSDQTLNQRSDDLYGESWPQRMLKDYNGQTYWLSANLKSFMPKSKLPPWLNIAVGYGADGMFGGTENTWTDDETGNKYDYTNVPRVRQWYLAPDIDFTKIRTKSKFLKSVFFCLNAFKMPAPTLLYSNGKFEFRPIYF